MKHGFSIMKKSRLRVCIALVIMIVGITLFIANLRFSIQFTGGVQIKIDTVVDDVNFKNTLQSFLKTK
jgi:preprotein translocase subunit SecF